MGPIKLKTWLVWAIVLFVLGISADYYFLHILFKEKQDQLNGALPASMTVSDSSENTAGPEETDVADDEEAMKENPPVIGDSVDGESDTNPTNDNFLASLKKCAPDIAAQAVSTPEALVAHLRQTVGVKNENVTLENFHLLWKDGSQRRLQVLNSDDSNNPNKKELRLFKLDGEGYPEPLPLKGHETLPALLSMGQVQSHEVKSQVVLKNKGQLELEMHDNQVFEFQYHEPSGKTLSCRLKDCQCA